VTSWKNIQIISLPVLPRTLFARLSLLSIGIDIKRIFIVRWCKSIANFMCVCVITKVTERCRLIFCNIYFLVYIIGKKKYVFPYDSCVFIFGRVRVFLVFECMKYDLTDDMWSLLKMFPCNVPAQKLNTYYLVYWNWMQLYIISFVSEKCVEIPVECMISINGQEVCIVRKSVQFNL